MVLQLYILALLLLAFTNKTYISGVDASRTFTLNNNCADTIWPGILTGAGSTPISTTGFELPQGASSLIQAPSGWGGRFWARTHCSNNSTGQFTCLTGDCGSGKIECDGGNAALPVTLAEFTMDSFGGMDFYDVSVVGGYNLPLSIVPQGGSRANCSTPGCVVDLNSTCPADLKVTAKGGEGIGCKSACAASNQDKDCCRGAYSTPGTCAPSSYTKAFKSACPHAFTYATDDVTSTFTCAGADYIIRFCPSPAISQNSSSSQNQLPDGNNNFEPSTMNGTMIYRGETDFVNSRAVSLSTTSRCLHVLRFARIVAVEIAVMRLYYNFS